MERQEENREMQGRLARMEALLMQHLGIRPHVPPTPRRPLSPAIKRSGPQSDNQPGHLTIDRAPLSPPAPSQSAHLDDHQPGHWTNPHRELAEDIHHLLDDHDEFMSQLMPPPRPPPPVAFGIGAAYKGVGNASLFLLVIEGRDGLSGGKAYQRKVQISYIISTLLISRAFALKMSDEVLKHLIIIGALARRATPHTVPPSPNVHANRETTIR
ncbi:hypothetical protein Scep_025853 [Stephania cephalantha]|uniref:Uncharacterized protein n=1 Tax=Stephania cephalantha TaxID=152367 RepID=A0AAP0EJG6_9MAGN